MRPKTYKLLEKAVEDGLRYGVAKTEKHLDTDLIDLGQRDAMMQNVLNSIMHEVSEWFEFEEI